MVQWLCNGWKTWKAHGSHHVLLKTREDAKWKCPGPTFGTTLEWNHLKCGFIIHEFKMVYRNDFFLWNCFETCMFRVFIVIFNFLLKVTIFYHHLGIPTTWSKSKLRVELALWLPSLVLTAGRGMSKAGMKRSKRWDKHFGPTQSPKCLKGSKNDSTKSHGWNWHGTSWKELILQFVCAWHFH